MPTVYVLAHFDDEYAALPLILRDKAEGREARFVYNMDYRTPALAQTRFGETRRFLRRFGLDPDWAIHLGRDTGVLDGSLYRDPGRAYDALKSAVTGLGPVERFVTTAWEGGHPDHDLGAALTVRLASELGGVPVEQVSLYNSPDLPWLFYHGARPLPQNGPVSRMPLSGAQWLAWAVSVADYPSQTRTWLGLWPAMAMTLVCQRDFRWQTLKPQRIAERPHEGPLFYERMFKVPYAAVRQAVDSLGPVG
jgi:LmbE family N-acetylglucosaminyl deacetylase